MAISLNFRVLMLFVALVIIMNITQIILSTRWRSKHHQHNVPAIFDDQEYSMNIMDVLKQLIRDNYDDDDTVMAPLKTTPTVAVTLTVNTTPTVSTTTPTVSTTPTVDNETCYNSDVTADDEEELKLCPRIPPGLSPSSIPATKEWLSNKLQAGGYHKNQECRAQQSIGVIIPYSGKSKTLAKFLYHLHPFLMKQQADYQIFVIIYDNKLSPLTLGQLFNIGFEEALKHRRWQCLVFHEPYLVPLDSRNLYRCNWYPRQLVTDVQAQTNDNKIYHYKPAFGGALALTPEQFSVVNGFSNHVSGGYAEYFDFHRRLQWANYMLERNDVLIGQYKTLVVPPAVAVNESSFTASKAPLHLLDGLNTLAYNVDELDYRPMFTSIRVSEEKSNNSSIKWLDVLLKHVLQF